MEDLLERMLAVDQQGEALIKEAEAKAVQIREESSAALAKANADASAKLAAECQALEAEAVGAAEKQRKDSLESATRALAPRSVNFARELEAHRDKLLKELLAL